MIVETGSAAVLFALVFAVGGRVHPLRSLIRDRRSIVSFGAGMSAAFVFVHLMPELHGARRTLAESVTTPLPYQGMATYFLALLGFLAFFGLEHLRAQMGQTAEAAEDRRAFRLHVGGFGVYVGVMAYLLVHNLGETAVSTGFYAVAIAFHFLAVDHALRSEHGAEYERLGRWVLAAMSLVGWSVGMLVALPDYAVALLVAFVSGAVIMNSCIMELPSDKDGRFVPFMTGGVLYGLILVPLG